MKKSFLRLTADTMQKLAIVGIAMGVFQEKNRWGMAGHAFSPLQLYPYGVGGEAMSAWTAYALVGIMVFCVGVWARFFLKS